PPYGSPLEETEQKAKKIEEILSKNPDVVAYVRRTGAELGLFATQTSRGDIQVVLREDEDPLAQLYHGRRPKPVRPEFSQVEAERKKEGKEYVLAKYRSGPVR